ncbi:MAG: flagellar type III secretion system protein FliR [Rhizobiaceae bacterium]|nr:flagellar type III secretion system protein FliR [Hyphomicrobiales bacterium]NRB30513.1 flagellar type III secretion system protein FliR [Rhizobiaceae bacterium]
MTALASDSVLLVLLAFCRVGGCFLVLPGLSSSRVPVQVRLLLVISITIAMLGQIWPLLATTDISQPSLLARLIVSETAIGVFIGLCVRFYLLALGFMATAMGTVIGFGNLMGPGFEETEPQAALGTLLTMAALLLLFIFDFHHAVIHSLIASYKVVPVNGSFETETYLANLTETLREAFMLVLRLGSPFIAYSLVVNLMIGILNKLTPQIPIYFISLPFLIFGGLLLLYFAVPTFLSLFVDGFFEFKVFR